MYAFDYILNKTLYIILKYNIDMQCNAKDSLK